MDVRLKIRPTQASVVTPRLQQAIRLLALNKMELQQFVDEELEQNPLLELVGLDEISELSNLEEGNFLNDPQDGIDGGMAADSVVVNDDAVEETVALELDTADLGSLNGLDCVEGSVDRGWRWHYGPRSLPLGQIM